MSPPIIRLTGLNKHFGENHVLRGIDLEVAKGEKIKQELAAVRDAALEDLAATSDAELRKEALEDGTDIKSRAAHLRASLRASAAAALRARMSESKARHRDAAPISLPAFLRPPVGRLPRAVRLRGPAGGGPRPGGDQRQPKPLRGRQRFSLAHELAHWLCDRKTGSFLCAKEVIGPQNAEAKSVEAHANGYASQLVLPDYLVVPWAEGKRANLDVAKSLAHYFNASLTAAAIKLAKRTALPS